MMIDFEDRMPSPPMGLGERVALVVVGGMTLYGFLSPFYTLWTWVAG